MKQAARKGRQQVGIHLMTHGDNYSLKVEITQT
jgi:hypothetical protein